MKKLLSFFLTALFIFILYSCTASKGVNLVTGITHSKEKIEKVHILVKLDKYKGYSKKLGQYIQEQLRAENIESTISYIDNMELNKDINESADNFKPSYTLDLRLENSDVYEMKQGGNIITLSYSVNISNIHRKNRIWEGSVIMSIGFKNKYQTKGAAQKLFKQLKNDGII